MAICGPTSIPEQNMTSSPLQYYKNRTLLTLFPTLNFLHLRSFPPCCSIIIVTLQLLQCTSCLAVSEHVCVSVSFSLFLLLIPPFVFISCFPTPSPLSSPDQARSTCHLLSTTFSLRCRLFQIPLAFLSLVSAIKTSV